MEIFFKKEHKVPLHVANIFSGLRVFRSGSYGNTSEKYLDEYLLRVLKPLALGKNLRIEKKSTHDKRQPNAVYFLLYLHSQFCRAAET